MLNQDLVEQTPQHKRILLYSKDATPFSFQSDGDFTPAELLYPSRKDMIIEEESYSQQQSPMKILMPPPQDPPPHDRDKSNPRPGKTYKLPATTIKQKKAKA